MTKTVNQLSLIFPLYNEAERFPQNFSSLIRLYKANLRWEFIFVNDGSRDETKMVVEQAIKPFPRMRLFSYFPNRGKGYALRRGMLAAAKQYTLFSDIDFSTPLAEVSLLMPFLNRADVVIGTRKVKGATILQHQPRIREWLGKRFTDLTNLWLGMDISDYTCGFKLFRTEVAQRLFKLQTIKRWSFDAEVLFLAKKFGYRIVEVPVTWQNDERTKVSLARDVLRSLWELWLIRWNWWRGKYKITT